jgi:hypothetical protein
MKMSKRVFLKHFQKIFVYFFFNNSYSLIVYVRLDFPFHSFYRLNFFLNLLNHHCGVDHNNNNNKNIILIYLKLIFNIIIIIIITIIAPVLTNTHSHISLFVALWDSESALNTCKRNVATGSCKYSMRTPSRSHFNFNLKGNFIF